ncbi:ATP-binding protein [uncultured Cohaesibacter sp.]|uniref:ATP-binding protein n=1 Tax=uncultured Cohaesibacter sp. TaxID=1002546 RepID=UPI00292DB9D4|nr:ATP-binding protein [uncultured Cohaesibacter sp.]
MRVFQKAKIVLFHLLMVSVTIVAVSFLFYGEIKNRLIASELNIDMYKTSLESAIYRYKFLPFILSQNNRVVDIATGDLDRTSSGYLLQRIKYATNVSTVFVMDHQGTVVASSNWYKQESYIGKNYASWPYFNAAMQGRLGQFYGIGKTSLKPGFFISYGLKSGEAIIGAIVIEINLSDLEEIWSSGPDDVVVMDVNNIIFISTNPDWKNKSIGDISANAIKRVESENRFAKNLIQPVNISQCYHFGSITLYSDSMFGCLVPGKISIEERIIEYGWTVLHFQDLRIYFLFAFVAFTVAILLYVIIIFAYRNFKNKHKRSLQLLRNQLVENSKLASIGQMATELSHEFNQPLSAIYMLLDTTRLLLGRKLYEQVDDNLALISSHIERMTTQISNLKSFASRHRVPGGSANIVAVANSSISLFEAILKKNNIQLFFQSSHNIIYVPCNEIGLEQILSNLITNAIEALAGQEKKRLSVLINKTDGKVLLTVRDNGAGLPDTVRIFESYYSTKQSGTGLGLAIVKGIIEHSHGTIKARTHPEGGAEFVIKWQEWRGKGNDER